MEHKAFTELFGVDIGAQQTPDQRRAAAIEALRTTPAVKSLVSEADLQMAGDLLLNAMDGTLTHMLDHLVRAAPMFGNEAALAALAINLFYGFGKQSEAMLNGVIEVAPMMVMRALSTLPEDKSIEVLMDSLRQMRERGQ